VPSDPARLTEFIRRELTAIQQAAHRAEPFLRLQPTAAEPTKAADGDVYFTDGTWDPGFGAGFYGRSGGAWVFLG